MMRMRAAVLVLSLGTGMVAGCFAGERKVLVIAHRGDSAVYPENTLRAFRSAAEGGADLVELDTHVTKDGVLVTIHDGTLDRTTNAVQMWGEKKDAVSAHTFEEIRRLDAGAWKASVFAGECVPTLAEALKTINARSMTLLERKEGSAMLHAKVLRSAGDIRRTVVQSFDWDFVAAMHTLLPEVRLAALSDADITEPLIADLRLTGAAVAAWDHEKLNPEAMAILRKAGLTVWVYTVDDPAEWERLYTLGVDGMITNKPKACSAWLKERSGG